MGIDVTLEYDGRNVEEQSRIFEEGLNKHMEKRKQQIKDRHLTFPDKTLEQT